jgi:hypothetical protein
LKINSEGLELLKAKMVESLSCIDVSEKGIEILVRLVSSVDCESMRITWRKYPICARFGVGTVWQEHFRRKSKILAAEVKTGSTRVQNNFECSTGTIQELQFELEPDERMKKL